MEEWEGVFPGIDVDRESDEPWLYWDFTGPESMRVEIRLVQEEQNEPWFYIKGSPVSLGREISLEDAEVRYGAITRLRLLEAHRAAILANQDEGLASLREAATAKGLFGKRERRYKRVELQGRVLDDATRQLTNRQTQSDPRG